MVPVVTLAPTVFVLTRSPQGTHQEPCPAEPGITLRQPFPELNRFGVMLYQSINKPAPLGIKTLGPRPCSLPPNAGQASRTLFQAQGLFGP